ncbi:MAG: hypothetical protein K2W78_09900 [Xanthobacteraceae bacterium]|nr:hypothetical protein [Xanthobacteraceae bacterium]
MPHSNTTASDPENLPPEQNLLAPGESDASESHDTASDAVEFNSPLLSASIHPKHPNPILRGVIRPLLAIVTSQYTLVALLAILAAATVSRQASHLINEKFLAIMQSLKRF